MHKWKFLRGLLPMVRQPEGRILVGALSQALLWGLERSIPKMRQQQGDVTTLRRLAFAAYRRVQNTKATPARTSKDEHEIPSVLCHPEPLGPARLP